MIKTLLQKWHTSRAEQVAQRSAYWKPMQALPPGLYPAWASSANGEFTGIPRNAFFFARATEGLLTFFDCVRRSGKLCGLPSRAADSVWHAWIALDPVGLDQFCKRYFGRTIAHTEAAGIGAGMAVALATCLVTARKLEGKAGAECSLPRLFALDGSLGMPRGFAYRIIGGRIGCASMDKRGQASGQWLYPEGMSAAGLLALGLVSQSEVDEAKAKQTGTDSGGDTGDFSFADGGSGCGDGGGDGGCGGGCGGD